MLSSSGREAAMFTVADLFPLKPVMLLMPCHMLLGLLLLKCSSTLFLFNSIPCKIMFSATTGRNLN